mmetsp:Transcript_7702/g.21071  ORF Transcript_7702/g.21071 Transcript_7702/m.21071 type:complete len:467 (-) Transcript_7702:128-1528(-)
MLRPPFVVEAQHARHDKLALQGRSEQHARSHVHQLLVHQAHVLVYRERRSQKLHGGPGEPAAVREVEEALGSIAVAALVVGLVVVPEPERPQAHALAERLVEEPARVEGEGGLVLHLVAVAGHKGEAGAEERRGQDARHDGRVEGQAQALLLHGRGEALLQLARVVREGSAPLLGGHELEEDVLVPAQLPWSAKALQPGTGQWPSRLLGEDDADVHRDVHVGRQVQVAIGRGRPDVVRGDQKVRLGIAREEGQRVADEHSICVHEQGGQVARQQVVEELHLLDAHLLEVGRVPPVIRRPGQRRALGGDSHEKCGHACSRELGECTRVEGTHNHILQAQLLRAPYPREPEVKALEVDEGGDDCVVGLGNLGERVVQGGWRAADCWLLLHFPTRLPGELRKVRRGEERCRGLAHGSGKGHLAAHPARSEGTRAALARGLVAEERRDGEVEEISIRARVSRARLKAQRP